MVALLHATSVILLDIFSYDRKCYDAMVQSTLNYHGAPIYYTGIFSCTDAVQNRAKLKKKARRLTRTTMQVWT